MTIPLSAALPLAIQAFHMRAEDFDRSNYRTEPVAARKRAAFWWLLREVTDASYPEIARAAGAGGHSTVYSAIITHKRRMAADAAERERCEVAAEWVQIQWRADEKRRAQ